MNPTLYNYRKQTKLTTHRAERGSALLQRAKYMMSKLVMYSILIHYAELNGAADVLLIISLDWNL